MNMWTWKLGGEPDSAQYWFGLRDPVDEWGVKPYHWYDDPSLSPNGAKLAMTDGGKQLMLASQAGPAWVGEPPYEIDYLFGETPVAAPELRCRGEDSGATNPSWSRDSRLLAYGASDGVRVMTVPDSLDCAAMTERTIAPGGTEPAFGPADVVAAKAPAAPAGPAAAVRGLSLRPRTFRASGRTALRFTLSAPARVRLVTHGRTRTVAGHRGVNRVRYAGRGLRPGRHRLTVTPAGGRARSTTFRIVR